LRTSTRFHIHESGVTSRQALVELIDRFIDGKLRYELEWDDFVSWEHDQPTIETVRSKIADMEPLFFAEDPDARKRAVAHLVAERNRIAQMCGMAARRAPDTDGEFAVGEHP
jgi:hypothetical protein